jgi:hypothetical protein
MDHDKIARLSDLFHARNAIDEQIAEAIYGRFRAGPLAGRTVNIKFYGKREGLLDTADLPALD